MKVLLLVLSVVCVSSARHVQWSPSSIEGSPEIREIIQQFWSQLKDLLRENDEESVKQILQEAFETYRPWIHGDSAGENNFGNEIVKPNTPFLHQHLHRPSHDDGEEIMRPLRHEDIDAEMLNTFPQKHFTRPLHYRPAEIDVEMEKPLMLRPLLNHPVEIDEEMEKSQPPKLVMCPSYNHPAEIEETLILRPLHDRPDKIDGGIENFLPPTYIMEPIHDRPAEHKEQMLPQMFILRPLEVKSGEIKDENDELAQDFQPAVEEPMMNHVMPPSYAPEIVKNPFSSESVKKPIMPPSSAPEIVKNPFSSESVEKPIMPPSYAPEIAKNPFSSESVEEPIMLPSYVPEIVKNPFSNGSFNKLPPSTNVDNVAE